MANKSVLELAVSTGQWDAGLRKAKQALDNFSEANGGLQQALQKESANMQKFVQMMGKMDSSAKTAKGQMSDYKSTIEQLTMQYNRMSEAQKQTIGQDYLNAIDSLRQKYQAVNEELQEMNRALSNTKAPDLGNAGGGGGPLGGNLSDMISVFGGNMMTKGAQLATDALRELGNQIVDTAKQAMQLSAQSEGIRIAFARLNRPDLLDQLREATHGTVSDLMLMQQAVKFDNFNLSLEQMGTFLAYAQQKAKDTGQSIDYMVDSIVTGLGRQSLMILDNLGLSAAEIKEEMKATGDMTTAVGEIIRRQMQSAGDYVETATDRANRATAEYENNLLKLGDTMRETFGVGTLDEFNMYLKNELVKSMIFTIETFNRARTALDDIYSAIESIGNNNAFARWAIKINEVIGPLGSVYGLLRNIVSLQGGAGILAGMGRFSAKMNAIRDRVVGGSYTVVKDASGKVISAVHRGVDGSVIDYTGRYATPATGGGGKGGRGGRGGGGGRGTVTPKEEKIDLKSLFPDEGEIHDAAVSYAEQIRSSISEAMAASATSADENAFRNFMQVAIENGMTDLSIDWETLGMQIFSELGIPDEKWEEIQKEFNERLAAMGKDALQIDTKTGNWMKPKKEKDDKKNDSIGKDVTQIVGSVNNIVSGISSLGIEVPAGIAKVLGVMQVIIGIISAIQVILAIIGVQSSIPFFAKGGLIGRAAGGMLIPGNSFSGDNLRMPVAGGGAIGVNSGELVLNRSQQGVLANALRGNAFDNLELTASLNGEDIVFAIDNASRRRGKGTMVRLRNG